MAFILSEAIILLFSYSIILMHPLFLSSIVPFPILNEMGVFFAVSSFGSYAKSGNFALFIG